MLTAPSPTAAIVTDGDMAGNVASFARHLRAANLSPATQRTYLASLERLASFLAERGMPTDVAAIRREHIEAFMEDQLARWKPTTAANRYSGIQPFWKWLVEEGEIRESPMARMRKPKLPEHAIPGGGWPGDLLRHRHVRGPAAFWPRSTDTGGRPQHCGSVTGGNHGAARTGHSVPRGADHRLQTAVTRKRPVIGRMRH